MSCIDKNVTRNPMINSSTGASNTTGYPNTDLTTLLSNISTANLTEQSGKLHSEGLKIAYNICVQYITFLIWMIAFPANIFIICLLLQKKHRKFSTSLYFISLALADLLVNFRTLQFWIEKNDLVTYKHDIECHISKGIPVFSMIASSWTLATISFERMLSVCKPHRVRYMCTKRNATISVIFIWAVSLGIGITNAWFYHSPNRSGCEIKKEKIDFFVSYIAWADFILDIVLPFVIILFNSIVILWNLSTRQVNSNKASKAFGASITITVLTINIIFVITQFPYGVMFVYQQTNKRYLSEERLILMSYVDGITLVLKYLNNALNFYLYFLAGSKFRQETKDFFSSLKQICFPLNKHINRGNTGRISLPQNLQVGDTEEQDLSHM